MPGMIDLVGMPGMIDLVGMPGVIDLVGMPGMIDLPNIIFVDISVNKYMHQLSSFILLKFIFDFSIF
jgi:hypothetical protein